MLGQTVGGRYQIIRYLGGGGFGQTYLAEDLHLPGNPHCVVKQLKPKVEGEEAWESASRLFNQEAEALYYLGNHDQIPRLFAHFEEQEEFYLVQELIEGEVLSRELKGGDPMSEADVLLLLQDILTTLEFVHQQHVVHRDIKPSNLIRRSRDRKIVLIDFGSVKQIGVRALSDDQATITIAIGSFGYIPNEQLAGKPRFASDIYALGMLAIQALTGKYPAQLRDDPKTGELLWRDHASVRPDVAEVLDTMVRYDFRQRYPSATEALAAVTNLITPAHATVILPKLSSSDSESYVVWCDRGDELFQQQRYEEAIACFDKVTQARSDDYLAWFKKAIALENLLRYEDAIGAYNEVIKIQSNDYLAWFKRGKALENLQRYEEALEDYDKVIQIQPDNYWAWHDRGNVLEASGRYEEAIASYDRAVQLKPDFQLAVDSRKRVLIQLRRVNELYHLQHYEEAVAACDRMIQDQPTDCLAWLMRGMALDNLQRYEESAKSYDQVVQIQPDDHLAWFKRGAALERLQQYQSAIDSYDRVIQLQADNYWAWYERGRLLELVHGQEEAIASYDKALQIKPDFQMALEGRKRLLNQWQQERSTSPTTDIEIETTQPGLPWADTNPEDLREPNRFSFAPALVSPYGLGMP